MFTWIITHQTKILSINKGTFTVENPFWETLVEWQSIWHDGACMTVTEFNNNQYSFFAMEESFRKTNFWIKNVGDSFNLELCLQAGSRLDWHIVSWHIDTVWTVSKRELADDWSLLLWFNFEKSWSDNVIEKWSITINWVSLTVVDKQPGFLSVRLIPLTQEVTNLWQLWLWDTVNLEFDMFGKYVINYMNQVNK